MQRTIGLIASLLIPLTLPLAAGAAERTPHGERSSVHEHAAPRAAHYQMAPRAVERPVYRQEGAPHAQYRDMRPRYETRVAPRHFVSPRTVIAPHRFVERRAYVAPRAYIAPRSYIAPRTYAAPRRVVIQRRIERRNTFVRYYPARNFENAPRRVVFRRYVPQRVFWAPRVQIVRTYVPRPVYVGYAPVYGSAPAYYNEPVQVPLPITWSPVNYSYNGYNGYNGYPYNGQYPSYPQNPYGGGNTYGNPYAYGYNNAPYGMNPFGNAQLQGVVLSNTNGGILVLTSDLKPIFVNTSIAQQNGYVNGQISPGSFVNVFGYNTGNEFIATALG